MKILCIGDIFAKPGRRVMRDLLDGIIDEYDVDYVIANGENMAHGKGFTGKTVQEMMNAGVQFFTAGNHTFAKDEFLEKWDDESTPIVRPANYLKGTPGKDHAIIETEKGKILLISILGKVYMGGNTTDPFDAVDGLLNQYNKDDFEAIIVDFHAEATAEKYTMRYFLDGRATVLFGTHTHVPTADAHVTDKGMGYITDLGMTGAVDSSIGLSAENIYERSRTSLRMKVEVETKGPYYLRGIVVDCENGECKSIEQIQKKIEI